MPRQAKRCPECGHLMFWNEDEEKWERGTCDHEER